MRALLILGILLSAGCKPIKYDQSIVCPDYAAHGVAVWRWDADTYLVKTPASVARVNDTGCVVTEQ